MLSIKKYREYFEKVALLAGIPESWAITVDKEMAKRIQNIGKGDTVLFWLPPAAKSDGSQPDSFREKNSCIVFVMRKYDAQREGAIDALEATQPIVEKVKEILVNDAGRSCSPIRIEVGSLDTLPETEFYGSMAGWSIGFRIITEEFCHG